MINFFLVNNNKTKKHFKATKINDVSFEEFTYVKTIVVSFENNEEFITLKVFFQNDQNFKIVKMNIGFVNSNPSYGPHNVIPNNVIFSNVDSYIVCISSK